MNKIRANWSIVTSHFRFATLGDLRLVVMDNGKRWGREVEWWVYYPGCDRVVAMGSVEPYDRKWRYQSYEREAMFRAEQAAATVPDGAA